MKTFEDEVRDMLRRRADDVAPAAPPWRHLDATALHSPVPHEGRARRLVAMAAAAALVMGLVGLRITARDDAPAPPAVGITAETPPPFDPATTSAVWPVGREGTPTSWFRTASEEPTRLQPPASDAPQEVALSYLRNRFGSTPVTLDDTAQNGARVATYRWRSPAGTGRVYLRRIVLSMGFPAVPYAWVVVGATSDHLQFTGFRAEGGRLQFELARHETTATAARVVLPTGASEVDLAQPQSIDVPLDRSATIRAELVEGGFTEWRVDPVQAPPPGKPSANLQGILEVTPNLTRTQAAARFLKERFDLGEDLSVEPVGGDSLDVRYRSTRIGSGTVRMGTTEQASIVVAVVGDGLMVEGMAITDDVRRLTLWSFLPGRVSVRLYSSTGKVIGRGSTSLPGVDMLAGLPVTMSDEPDPDTAPLAEFRVDGPRGTTVAVYCLIG